MTYCNTEYEILYIGNNSEPKYKLVPITCCLFGQVLLFFLCHTEFKECNIIICLTPCRFDERVLLISLGVVTAIVGRAAFFPFPGVDNPAVCVGVPNNCTIKLDQVWGGQPILSDDLPKCKLIEEIKFSNPYEHQNHGKFVSSSFSCSTFLLTYELKSIRYSLNIS